MDKGKIITYGSNLIANPIANLVKASSVVGNPGNLYCAAFYGILDTFNTLSPKIKKSTFNGLAKLVGMGFFGVKSIGDLTSIVNGKYMPAIDLAFDASMLYKLGKDVFSTYGSGQGKKDLVDDLSKLKLNNKVKYIKTKAKTINLDGKQNKELVSYPQPEVIIQTVPEQGPKGHVLKGR